MSGLNFRLYSAGVISPQLRSLNDLRQRHIRAMRAHSLADGVVAPLNLQPPPNLPANESRRTSSVVRLVLACVDQAMETSPFQASSLRSVFATDEGTGEVLQQILESLATSRQVSPIAFTNSLHGAPSGYFSIAVRNHQPAVVVSLGMQSFASGLLCAVTDAVTEQQPVLFVSYDPVTAAPFDEILPITEPTATAWVISALSVGAGFPRLGHFELTLNSGELASNADSLASWLPHSWAANSSAHGFAALGLLDANPGSCCQFALHKHNLVLKCVE